MSLAIIKKLSPAFIAISLAVISLNTIRLAQTGTNKVNRKPALEQKTIKIKSLESNIAASLVAAYR